MGPGTQVEDLTITTRLPGGNVGEAYLLSDGRVLKILREDLADDFEIRARFEAEIRLQRVVRSPHVPVVDGAGEHLGRPYFVMAHHPGMLLSSYLEKGSALSADLVGSGILEALAECHASHVVHRDIKADNVLVALTDPVPHVSLIDFGVACAPSFACRTKVQFGSPVTWGPERLLGLDGADHRSDLFSAGLLLYILVSRAHPFGHRTPDWAELLVRCQAPPLRVFVPEVSALDTFFRTALAKELDERFQSAESMKKAWRQAWARRERCERGNVWS